MEKITAITKKNNYYTELKSASNHTVIADEPEDLGGKNQGFTPSELLAASLASCTSITLRMYANRKEWPIDEIHVNVDSEKIANEISMKRSIRIEGQLDEQQTNRLLSIANACPMHKLLSKSISIETTLNLE